MDAACIRDEYLLVATAALARDGDPVLANVCRVMRPVAVRARRGVKAALAQKFVVYAAHAFLVFVKMTALAEFGRGQYELALAAEPALQVPLAGKAEVAVRTAKVAVCGCAYHDRVHHCRAHRAVGKCHGHAVCVAVQAVFFLGCIDLSARDGHDLVCAMAVGAHKGLALLLPVQERGMNGSCAEFFVTVAFPADPGGPCPVLKQAPEGPLRVHVRGELLVAARAGEYPVDRGLELGRVHVD